METRIKKEELMHVAVLFIIAVLAFLGGCMLMYFENN